MRSSEVEVVISVSKMKLSSKLQGLRITENGTENQQRLFGEQRRSVAGRENGPVEGISIPPQYMLRAVKNTTIHSPVHPHAKTSKLLPTRMPRCPLTPSAWSSPLGLVHLTEPKYRPGGPLVAGAGLGAEDRELFVI